MVPRHSGVFIPCHVEVSVELVEMLLYLVVREGVITEEGGLSVSDKSGFFVRFLSDVSGAGDALFRAESTPEEGVVTGASVGEVVFKGAWMSAQEFVHDEEEIQDGGCVGAMVPGGSAVIVDKREVGKGKSSEKVVSNFRRVGDVGVPSQGVKVEVALNEG